MGENIIKRYKGLFLLFFILFSIDCMQGQVSVVGTTAGTTAVNYATLNAAFGAINAGTHKGAITVTITGNTTEPAIAIPLLKSATPSSYSSILIKPSGGDFIINSAATPTASKGVIILQGADNVTIDGDNPGTIGLQNLSFVVNTNSNDYTAAIQLASNSIIGADGADNNTIKNCIITGGRRSASTRIPNFGIVMSDISSISKGAYSSINTKIENNVITRCYIGIYANGGSSTYPNTGLQILNNTLGSATSDNNIGSKGIYVSCTAISGTGALIKGNDIRAGDYSTTGFSDSVAGIEINSTNYGVRVIGNNIHDIYQQNSNGYYAVGIYFTDIGSSNNNSLGYIQNNIIRDIVASKNTTSITAASNYGIYFSSRATNYNIDHNTIVFKPFNFTVGDNSVSDPISACVAIADSGVTISSFRNNIIFNSDPSQNAYGIYCISTTNISGGTINNNNYYVPYGRIGYYTNPRSSLSSWIASTSKDANSINVNPPFVSSTDMHIRNNYTNAVLLDGTGAAGLAVTTDIDNETRNATTPDIGADEFSISPPTITTVTPSSLCIEGGQTLTIKGTSFFQITAVQFNGVNATSFTVLNSTNITAICPANLVSGSITITGAFGTTTLDAAYSVPTISTQPTAQQSICIGGSITALNVNYIAGTGTATYQWYSNTTNSTSGGTAIAGAISSSYIPPAYTTVGTYYYYVAITLSGSSCVQLVSNLAEVNVVADPVISSSALATQTQCQNTTATNLTVQVTGGMGTISYQWYSNTTNSTTGGVLISGATASSYSPSTAMVGTQYYYVVVTQNFSGCSVTSAVSTVIVVSTPSITTQPVSNTVCKDGTTPALTIAYFNGAGTPTYQWFKNTINSNTGGTLISGATSSSYTPLTNVVGTTYYYATVNFSGGCSLITSNIATITVNPLPTISTQPTAQQSICIGGSVVALNVNYIAGTGTATYQWYSNTTNSTSGGTAIAGATSSSYIPPVFTTVGTYYYYAAIALSGSSCGALVSNVAQVNVVADPVISSSALATQTQCQNAPANDLTIQVTGGLGNISYQWYSNTTNSTTGGVLISGATASSYSPSTAMVGTQYYYVIISQNASGCSVTSAVSTVIVVSTPSITTQPVSNTVCKDGTTPALTIAYFNGAGTPTYQWYKNTINSTTGGTPISGATVSSYTPLTNVVGTTYYYATVNFSGGCSLITSNTAAIIVNSTIIPTFTQVADVNMGATMSPLPTTSTNGITGTWSPALNNMVTTTYTFTPAIGQCASTASMTIIVIPVYTQVQASQCDITLPSLTTTINANAFSGATGYRFEVTDGSTLRIFQTVNRYFNLSQLPGVVSYGTTYSIRVAIQYNSVWQPYGPSCIVSTNCLSPTFTQVPAICSGGSLAALPTTSTNGITGTWSPALNTSATTTYTFTPSNSLCSTTASMTITVNPTPLAPVGNAIQLFCVGETPTIAELIATGTNVQWYANQLDAINAINPIPNTTLLINDATYYASQTANGCESSDFLSVQVKFNDLQITASETTVCSGTQVSLTASTTALINNSGLPTNLQNGLVGYWPFNGNANDSSGNGNNGTVNGATLTTDRFGTANKAYTFDGNDYIEIQDSPSLNFSDQFSLSFYVKNEEPVGGWYMCVNKDNWGESGIVTFIAENKFFYSKPEHAGWIISTDLSANSWDLITITNNNGLSTLYKNGQFIMSDTIPIINNSESLVFGGSHNGGVIGSFKGILDDIIIWNRALSLSEIQQLYTPAPSYLWSTGETTSIINPNPTETTTYWCDVTVNGATCRKEISITVNSTTPAPVASSNQTFCVSPAPTVASLTATGTGIQWYDAEIGGNLFASTATLTDGQTVYASQTENSCESTTRTAVTVSVNDPQITASATTVCAGTAVNLTASTAVSAGIGSTLPTNLQNGLVGYWPFNGNANDVSGNGNNGTVNGAILTSDRFGNSNGAYSFDGVNNYISVQDSNTLHQNVFTISSWVNGDEYNGFKQILSKNIGTSNNESINLVINNNSGWNLTAQIGGLGYYGTLIKSPNTISEQQWHHVVYVYNENNQSQKLFLDGSLVKNNTTTDLIQFDNKPLTFGAQLEFNVLQYFFNGKLDDIGFWNRELNQQEISQIYNSFEASYLWSTGETTATINPNPTETTTYWCDVTVNGSTCRKEMTITVNPLTTYYADADGDGFGSGAPVLLCSPTPPTGYATNNLDCNDGLSTLTTSCVVTLPLKVLIQGYYKGSGQMTPVRKNAGLSNSNDEVDEVTVALYSPSNVNQAVATTTVVLATNGTATAEFDATLLTESNYYLSLQHKNTIKTWSATPVAITNGTTYDFTTAASQAYGNNQIEVAPGIYAIYSGDMNQDGTINEADLPIFTTANTTAAHGYIVSDLNGDGSVDLLDYPIYKNNAASSVNEVRPLPLPVIPALTTTEVSNITTTAAITGGTITSDGGANVTARGIVWSTSPSPTIAIATKTTDGTGTGTFTNTLTGLAPATTYYVRAYATNAAGTAYGNEVSFTTTNERYVGELFGGGIVVSIWETDGVQHGLIASLTDLGMVPWTTSAYSGIAIGTSAGSFDDGLANTNAIVAQAGAGTTYAAGLCKAYNAGGYTDWYLPARNELQQCYNSRHTINTVLGSNGFQSSYYWSSSERLHDIAWIQDFSNGVNYTGWKPSNDHAVRAVRRF
jgi:hypothetical protein